MLIAHIISCMCLNHTVYNNHTGSTKENSWLVHVEVSGATNLFFASEHLSVAFFWEDIDHYSLIMINSEYCLISNSKVYLV